MNGEMNLGAAVNPYEREVDRYLDERQLATEKAAKKLFRPGDIVRSDAFIGSFVVVQVDGCRLRCVQLAELNFDGSLRVTREERGFGPGVFF
jgi:hypothetical protein